MGCSRGSSMFRHIPSYLEFLMRKLLIAGSLALVAGIADAPLGAQSENAVAGWVGLIVTPIGGLAPVILTTPRDGISRGIGAQVRVSHWQFADDDDNTRNMSVGVTLPTGSGRATIEIGRTSKKGCPDCGATMAGAEMTFPLRSRTSAASGATPSEVEVGINPAIGYMTQSNDGETVSAMGFALSIPVAFAVPVGAHARLVPFLSPGAGLGRVSGGGDSITGTRLMLGGGLALAGVGPGLQFTGSFRKIFMDGGPTVFGLGLTLGQ